MSVNTRRRRHHHLRHYSRDPKLGRRKYLPNIDRLLRRATDIGRSDPRERESSTIARNSLCLSNPVDRTTVKPCESIGAILWGAGVGALGGVVGCHRALEYDCGL